MTTPSSMVERAAILTKAEREIMLSFTPETYAINFPRDRVKRLVKLGLLEWLPPVWGNATNWGATPQGREIIAALKAIAQTDGTKG